jgi:hypothetical protein
VSAAIEPIGTKKEVIPTQLTLKAAFGFDKRKNPNNL